ncbi:hypothetical protein [Ascidiimonas sp. W6]|uniref:hypothetical protein n=1 Tax=Ascidiimonas meishanensis TaxID=3128903 RepID=UPI0030EB8472
MKKLAIISTIALGGFASFATTPVIFHDGIVEEVFNRDFHHIEIRDLPNLVLNYLSEKYPEGVINKIHANSLKEYKIELVLGVKSTTVFLNQFGILLHR